MAQTLTYISLAALGGYLFWRFRESIFRRDELRITIGLDRSAPGAHLIWDIFNTGSEPVTLTKLIVHGPHGANDTVPLGLPETLQNQERVRVAIDADWGLLSARSIVAVDENGREHVAPYRQLEVVQDHLRQLIDRRVYSSPGSAREFLFGATDLAFGVVILGLGFFMLMWVIATG
jgi:hypothetical protein